MCGIIGLITNLKNINISKKLIESLIQLQNRGYDSTGICTLNDKKKFEINKYASSPQISSIEKLISLNIKSYTNIGIGHNRWATHGPKNNVNAHPHKSNDEKFSLVHNGIIENYLELKDFLIKNEYQFYSETDTEVIVNLISHYYQIENNVFEAIKKTISRLQGSYGLIIMTNFEKDKFYAVRNGSPLLIGCNNDYAIITSEQSGFCNMVNTYITLNNDDICIIEKNDKEKIIINTSNTYTKKEVYLTNNELTPEPYPHWTLKEIFEQPNTINNCINLGGRIKNESEVKLGGLEPHINILKNIDNLILLGCGTSYHAGLYGMYYIKKICNFNVVLVIDGADFNYTDIPKIGTTACVFISQSGETKDLHRCIEITKEHNIFSIGVINVVDSLIAREVNCGMYCYAGREIGVASTKAFTSQVICLSILSIWFSQIHDDNMYKRMKMISDLRNLSNNFKITIENIDESVKNIANNMNEIKNLFLLGKGSDEYIAKEGSLKIKEISYIHSEGYSSSSLKHGPFALLDEKFPTIILNLLEEHNSKTMNCFEEVHSRNSPIILITNNQEITIEKKCEIIKIPKNETYNSLIGIIPLQLLAYYLSINRSINPDIPKNLAKVVTVE